MTILIDARAGSEDIITHPPFSICPHCSSPLTITREPSKRNHSVASTSRHVPRKESGRIISALCPIDPKHRTLARLVPLSRLTHNDDGGTSSVDVKFSGNGPNGAIDVVIEVKKLSDLLTSLDNGRLVATQIPSMIKNGDERWLLYYGAYQENPDNGNLQTPYYDSHSRQYRWKDYVLGRGKGSDGKGSGNGRERKYSYQFIERFLASPSLTRIPIHVKHFHNIEQLSRWIGNTLYPIWQKEWSAHRSMFKFDDSARFPGQHLLPDIDPITYQIMLTAASFPSIGYERAKDIALHFSSISDMLLASEKEWAEIKVKTRGGKGRDVRIGPVRAKAIYDAIRTRRNGKEKE